MRCRLQFLVLILFAFPAFIGCGSGETTSPSEDDLARYVQENPEAAKRAEQEEPEGFDGPTELPGE